MDESSRPLVSVVMPCHNDGKYLPFAVESLRAQTYPNIELIVIDDGSDDPETLEVIGNLSFPRMKLLHTVRLFPSGARNAGIAESSGKYILPLDADDSISPIYVEKAVSVLESNEKVGIVYCHADLFGEASGEWALPDFDLEHFLLNNCIFVSSFFRRKDWEAVGGFCTDFACGLEDYDFWLSILELDRQVVQLPETLFHCRVKTASRNSTFHGEYHVVQRTYERLYKRHRELYRKNMDMYCLSLRSALVDCQFRLGDFGNTKNTEQYSLEEWCELGKRQPKLVSLILALRSARTKFRKTFFNRT